MTPDEFLNMCEKLADSESGRPPSLVAWVGIPAAFGCFGSLPYVGASVDIVSIVMGLGGAALGWWFYKELAEIHRKKVRAKLRANINEKFHVVFNDLSNRRAVAVKNSLFIKSGLA